MSTEFIAITGAIATVLAGFGGAALGACFAYKTGMKLVQETHKNAIALMRRQEFFVAASKFKATIIYELVGFYPIDQHWEKNEWPRVYQSIPKVNSAAAEFRYFVTGKDDFDKSISEYNKYCRESTADKVFILDFSKSMPGKYLKDYMKEFNDIVNHILSFANEK